MVLAIPVARAAGEGRELAWLTSQRYAAWLTAVGLGGTLGSLDDARAALLFSESGDAEREAAWGGAFRDVALAVSFLPDPGRQLARSLERLGVAQVRSIAAPAATPPAAAGRQFLRQLTAGAALEDAWRQRALSIPERVRALGDDAWARLGMDGAETLVVHPGSGSSRKNLPAALLLDAAVRASRRLGLRLAALLGPVEEEGPATRAVETQGLPVARRLGLLELTGFLSRAAGVITHDSGVGHLAAAAGTPVLLVFGPTDPRIWAPPFCNVGLVWCGARDVPAAERGALEEVGWWRGEPACCWPDGMTADRLAEAIADGLQAVSTLCADRGDRGGGRPGAVV